jgi:Ca2+-binding EF-hand superfamily protein
MKNNRIKTAVLVFGAILFFANSSFAQSQNREERRERPTFEQLIEKMDVNKDGKLSKAEIKGPLEKNFDKVDTDEDGFITEKEFEEAPKPKRGPKR